MRIMDLTENNKWEHNPNLNKNLDNRISVDDPSDIAPKTTPNVKQMIPWDSYTYTVDEDIWYQFYRTAIMLGCEDNMNDYSKTKQSPHISFYTKSERDRFLKICHQNGIKYKELKGDDIEEKGTQITSCVPNPSFRDIF